MHSMTFNNICSTKSNELQKTHNLRNSRALRPLFSRTNYGEKAMEKAKSTVGPKLYINIISRHKVQPSSACLQMNTHLRNAKFLTSCFTSEFFPFRLWSAFKLRHFIYHNVSKTLKISPKDENYSFLRTFLIPLNNLIQFVKTEKKVWKLT